MTTTPHDATTEQPAQDQHADQDHGDALLDARDGSSVPPPRDEQPEDSAAGRRVIRPGDHEAAAGIFTEGLRAFLVAGGINPFTPGLVDTPARVMRALREMTAGYAEDPATHLARTFPVNRDDGPILVTGVPFTSLCAHHLLPFNGTADIAYQPAPGQPVAGLSKLPRVLDVYARRLQTQEELTHQVTAALDTHLSPLGAACIIRSEHGCLAHRGARKPGAVMITASYTGRFLDDPTAREELHRLMT